MYDNLFCKIFVNTKISRQDLATLMASHLNYEFDEFFSIENDGYTLDILINKEFDENQAKEYPDGFLYYPYLIEIDISNINPIDYIMIISQLLNWLWENDCELVAACDFEEELPNQGGYKYQVIE